MDNEDKQYPHIWVKISYTTLHSVRVNPDGSFSASISPEAMEAAQEGAVIGCWSCEEPLNALTINTPCTPIATE